MIDYINGKLDKWGRWTLGGRARLGYPRKSAFVLVVGGRAEDICDDEAMQINRAVQSLDRQLRAVVDAFYVRMRSCDGDTVARALGCCRGTMYARLHSAHLRVMESIQDEELADGWREPARRVGRK